MRSFDDMRFSICFIWFIPSLMSDMRAIRLSFSAMAVASESLSSVLRESAADVSCWVALRRHDEKADTIVKQMTINAGIFFMFLIIFFIYDIAFIFEFGIFIHLNVGSRLFSCHYNHDFSTWRVGFKIVAQLLQSAVVRGVVYL